MKLSGVIVPHVTPLTPAEGLDEAGLDRLIDFLLDAGVHGLFANGSMGGFAFLPDAVQFQTIARTVERTAGRVPVLAGVSDTSTTRVLARLREVQRLEPDAVVVMPPFYYLARQDELLHFFDTVADAAERPVVLYDNPKLAKNALAPETIGVLARHPNVVGAKISAGDAFKWQEILRQDLPRERFGLICGAEPMMSLALQLGFDGITGGLHNLCPRLAVALVDAARAGRFDEAEQLQRTLNRLLRVFEIDGGWRGAELTLAALGICAKVTASPHDIPMPPAKRREIFDILEREGIVPRGAAIEIS
ncbi:MAG TPA: dihydrodipicolinate synthase family protein [Vicinamibacterales bacterium]